MTISLEHRFLQFDEACVIVDEARRDFDAASVAGLDHAAELLRDVAQACRGLMRTQLPDRDGIAGACDIAARLLEHAAADLVSGRCDGAPLATARRCIDDAALMVGDAGRLLEPTQAIGV